MPETLRDPKNRRFYLPRLPADYYEADAAVIWTLPSSRRATGWLDDTFHFKFRELLLHACIRESMLCPTYVLMPDHIHFVWLGCKIDSNQRNAIAFLRRYVKGALPQLRLQHQSHDHVFKGDERRRNAFSKACTYVLLNPVRARLTESLSAWPYAGAILPGYPDLNPFTGDFWNTFWKIYEQKRDPACADRVLPPITLRSSRGNEALI